MSEYSERTKQLSNSLIRFPGLAWVVPVAWSANSRHYIVCRSRRVHTVPFWLKVRASAPKIGERRNPRTALMDGVWPITDAGCLRGGMIRTTVFDGHDDRMVTLINIGPELYPALV